MVKSVKRVSTVRRLAPNTHKSPKSLSSAIDFKPPSTGTAQVSVPNLTQELIDDAARNKNDLLILQKPMADLHTKLESLTPFTQLCDSPR